MTPLARLLLAALCTLILTGTAHADRQEELENLRKRIREMQNELEKTSESRSDAADALRESERAISDSNRKLSQLTTQQRAAGLRLGDLKTQERKLRSGLHDQQEQLGKLLHRQYQTGGQEHLALLLNGRDPDQTARDLHYYQYIARDRAAWLAGVRSDLAELNTVSLAVRTQLAEIESLRAEEVRQKKALEQEQRSRLTTLKNISQQLRKQRREIGRLQRDENRLTQLVNRLTKMLAQPKSSSLLRNNNLPDARYDGKLFAKLRGKLAFPVKGDITNRFGAARPESNLPWKGLFLRTSTGQPVKVIAAGRVVFADWLRGFGNLMIVDHGQGYMSLYGNNETLYKQIGDELHGGDTIAAVGNSGGNEDSGLYFELRYESKPLDPMAWLVLK